MIALFIAAALAAQTPPAAAALPPAADPPPKSVEERLSDLHIMYDQTCVNRAYGAYDDLCENLGDQIRRAQREMQKPHPAKPPAAQDAAKPAEASHPVSPSPQT
jgi:hypothetical protein